MSFMSTLQRYHTNSSLDSASQTGLFPVSLQLLLLSLCAVAILDVKKTENTREKTKMIER